MSIASEITRLQNAKASIKTSIENKGVTVGDGTIDTYASKIDAIETGITPTGTINITENGTYDVTDKASANVNVSADVSDYFGNTISLGNSISSGVNNMIKKIPNNITISGTSCNYMFRQCQSLQMIPQLDTSNVTSMERMFEGCKSLTSIPLLDTSKVTNMTRMFWECSSLQMIPQLDTSNVTNMQGFCGWSSLTSIPQLDTSKVTNISNMFQDATNLIELPLLNMSNADTLTYCFSNSYNLTTLGGFQNLGQAYLTTANANRGGYKLDLSSCTKLTYDSLMNVINKLYDIATKGVKTQQLVLGSTNMAKLTAEEIAIATNKGFSVS